jgi:hypothetical protein
LQKAKAADAAILNAWTSSANVQTYTNKTFNSSISISPNNVMPFYTNKNTSNNPYNTSMGNYMWLFAGKC